MRMVFFLHLRHKALRFMHYCKNFIILYKGSGMGRTDGSNDYSPFGLKRLRAKK